MPESAPLANIRVVAFENRLSGPMAELIRKHGGEPVEAPALREVPLGEKNPLAANFAHRLVNGEFDVVIFLTGVGARYLIQEVEAVIPREDFLMALARVQVVVRGPKPLAVLRNEWKARVDVQVPEPNTWRDIVQTLDARGSIQGLRIAIQEYGKPSPDLVHALEHRGAAVSTVPVYRWELPEDTQPLRLAIKAMVAGEIQVAMFTSAQQVVHLLQVADAEGEGKALRSALASKMLVASIGPTTTETLIEHGLKPDVEPEHPKMGHLVAAVAKAVAERTRIEPVTTKTEGGRSPLDDSPFMKACRREPTDVTPIWLMRQAGRYMSEYRSVRSKVGFLELCKNPDLATEVTVTAAERLGVDAAILFADILLILEPMGLDLEFAKGEGPIIHNPVRQASDVDRVNPLPDPEALNYVFQAVTQIRAALPAHIPLIGFAGAPFTLACYAIEGGSSRHYEKAKAFMYADPGAWDALMDRLTEATSAYLNAQVRAGAQVVQLFDSWVGNLSPDDYRRFVQPSMKKLFDSLPEGVPSIHFGTDTGSLLELQRDAGGDVIGLDWRIDLDKAWERLGPDVAVQGNLDPTTLFAPLPELERQVHAILKRADGRPGHIFNLGHGILPTTPVDSVRALVQMVHEASHSQATKM